MYKEVCSRIVDGTPNGGIIRSGNQNQITPSLYILAQLLGARIKLRRVKRCEGCTNKARGVKCEVCIKHGAKVNLCSAAPKDAQIKCGREEYASGTEQTATASLMMNLLLLLYRHQPSRKQRSILHKGGSSKMFLSLLTAFLLIVYAHL